LRTAPIFDTNIFGHVQDGSIRQEDWRKLLRHRPGNGWPLSMVTAFELLAGIDKVPPHNFYKLKGQFELAYQLSKGRILDEPRFLLCKDVLRVPFPTELGRPETRVIRRYMEVVLRAKSKEEILDQRVPFGGILTRGRGRAGFATSVLTDLVGGPKAQWMQRVEEFATDVYPQWRDHREKTGKRLPDEMREAISSRSAWEGERNKFAETVLAWLHADRTPESIAKLADSLDAAIEFTIFAAREFLTRDYMLEKHLSDVYDQFQLHYLAMTRFVIVSNDADFTKRLSKSSQANRIMSFEKFLQNF
jgi:hypothetical protein